MDIYSFIDKYHSQRKAHDLCCIVYCSVHSVLPKELQSEHTGVMKSGTKKMEHHQMKALPSRPLPRPLPPPHRKNHPDS